MKNYNEIGVIGLAVMGKNIALNIADHDYQVAVYNRTYTTTEIVCKENKQLEGYSELSEFVDSLKKPRKILLMVKAGEPVDLTIQQLIPLLDKEDIIMDGGNSYYKDTIRREAELKSLGINFLGVGISGGEEGARFGPAIMPSGNYSAYQQVEPIFKAISAEYKQEPCVSYIGENGAGHYVKMIHNGIEYGDMQLIAEAYHILKSVGNLSNEEIADIFKEYNDEVLQSYLMEISSTILKTKDDLTEGYLIDKILDKASQKGTGLWTVESSLNEGVNISVISAAVYNRIISSAKDTRILASKEFKDIETAIIDIDSSDLIKIVEDSLYFAKIISYAQGFDLLKEAANNHGWTLNFENIAKGWREGCIIRAAFLDDIANAYQNDPNLENLIFNDFFKNAILNTHRSIRELLKLGIDTGVSLSGFANAQNYFDALRNDFNPANLLQGQRDYFGAHKYERNDREGVFHFDWEF